MYRFIEINPAASASTSERNIPVKEAISTQSTSVLILRSAMATNLPSGRALTHQGQTIEEDAWNAYKRVKPLFYEVCRMLADS
jgi:hypothetical protein